MNTRALAARIVTAVFDQGESLTDALDKNHKQLTNPKDQALLQELCYGVCRWWWRFDAVLDQLLERPLKSKDIDLKHLAMVGLYQLMELRIPDHAAVAETVNGCKDIKKPWARNLLNAVLRNYQRNAKTICANLSDDARYQFSHPDWLLDKIRKSWPNDWQNIVDASNQKPPMVLRVNLQKKSRAEYLNTLRAVNIVAKEFTYGDAGVVLEKPVAVEQLPGFDRGWVSVQDGAAQLAAGLLESNNAKRVLDVCAAPGGKAAHILELAPALDELVALDIDALRLKRVEENMNRLGLKARLIQGDAQSPSQWWDQRLFDRILLDAPCSATGVIRRHPDIKKLRRSADIANLVKLQAHILDAVWPLLTSGGILLYVTCSILPEENVQQIDRFLKSHPDARLVEIAAGWGVEQRHGRQLLPGQENMDGFYYACLQKY